MGETDLLTFTWLGSNVGKERREEEKKERKRKRSSLLSRGCDWCDQGDDEDRPLGCNTCGSWNIKDELLLASLSIIFFPGKSLIAFVHESKNIPVRMKLWHRDSLWHWEIGSLRDKFFKNVKNWKKKCISETSRHRDARSQVEHGWRYTRIRQRLAGDCSEFAMCIP